MAPFKLSKICQLNTHMTEEEDVINNKQNNVILLNQI